MGQNPQIILADEPVAALDPVTSNQVMEDFRKINKENKITILLNIHDVDLALKYCDRVIGINKGRIVYDGKSSDITKEILDKIYKKDLILHSFGNIPKNFLKPVKSGTNAVKTFFITVVLVTKLKD